MESFSQIRYSVEEGIATVEMHRPERLNAFTPTMGEELRAAFDLTDANDDVRVVIVTGSGRAFCAGADLSKGGGTFDHGKEVGSKEVHRDGGGRLTLRIFQSLKPVIGAINGPAVGIGATMTLPMDFRMASESARVGFVFSRRGVVPEAASSWFLPRVVGISQAMEWIATGRIFDAPEALRGRLIRSIHKDSDLLPAARRLGQEIASNTSSVSVALSRQMLWRNLGTPHPMFAHRSDSRGMVVRGQSQDAYEGISSFLEKRAPLFTDKVSDGLPDIFPDWQEPEFS